MLGAALAAAAPGVPAWQTGFEGGSNLGGLLSAVLEPTGTFGKVLLGIVALTTSSACAPTMYTFGSCPFHSQLRHISFCVSSTIHLIFQGQASWLYLTYSRASHVIFFPSYLLQCKCPVRHSASSTILFFVTRLLPLSIIGAKRFYTTLVDILSALFLPSYTCILTGWLLPIRYNWLLVHSICGYSPD